MNEPLLTVCLITYNHVSYIEQAIESVLMQKVNFTWELIIADDYSTDGTREIIKKYKEKYSDFIKLILQERNVGAARNWLDLITSPKSKYIAYFEGDDYWTDSLKLQKQIDFLEKHDDFALCFHNAIIENHLSGSKILFHTKKMPLVFSGDDLLKQWLIPTASAVMRNVIPETFPSFFNQATHGDLALFLYVTQYGKLAMLPEVMSVYRLNETGVTNNFKGIKHNLSHIEQCQLMKDYFKPKYWYLFSKRISTYYLSTARLSAKIGRKEEAFNYCFKAFRWFPLVFFDKFSELFKLIIEFSIPANACRR